MALVNVEPKFPRSISLSFHLTTTPPISQFNNHQYVFTIPQSKMHALLDLAALAGMIKAATRLYTPHCAKNLETYSKSRMNSTGGPRIALLFGPKGFVLRGIVLFLKVKCILHLISQH